VIDIVLLLSAIGSWPLAFAIPLKPRLCSACLQRIRALFRLAFSQSCTYL